MIGIREALQTEAAVREDLITDDELANKVHSDQTDDDGLEQAVPFSSITIAEEFLLMDEDKDVIVDPVASTTNRVSFMRRLANRPTNLKLGSNNSRSVTPSENSVDDTESASGSDQVDGKRRRNRISKPLDVGFRNLSYSVKTGLFRGKCVMGASEI